MLTTRNKQTMQGRQRSGSMLAIIILSTGLVALLFLFCLSLGALFLAHYRVQNALDQVALTGACKLNAQDRIGQMNNIIARSRQLVYASRQTESEIAQKRPQLRRLAASLLDEARSSARDVEQEAKRLLTLSSKEATRAMNDEFDKTCGAHALRLPGLEISTPVLVETRLGSLQGVDSNVSVLHGMPELADFDKHQSYINKKPDLYVQGANLKLPSEDADLNFNLASLPAFVNNISAPARLVLPGSFQSSMDRQLKSAAQVEATADVKTPYGTSTIRFLSTATTYGGAPIQ